MCSEQPVLLEYFTPRFLVEGRRNGCTVVNNSDFTPFWAVGSPVLSGREWFSPFEVAQSQFSSMYQAVASGPPDPELSSLIYERPLPA